MKGKTFEKLDQGVYIWFRKQREKGSTITGPILFLDNCNAHSNDEELVSDDGNIIAKFFPPNVTALIQPMDQGLLESIKRVYRKYILRGFVCQMTFTI